MPDGQHMRVCPCSGKACTKAAGDISGAHSCGRVAPCAKARLSSCYDNTCHENTNSRKYKSLAVPCDIVFIYDGSLAGFYCCVHESVYSHRIPAAIMPQDELQPILYEQEYIRTDMEQAGRVRNSVAGISPRVMDLLETVYYSCLPGREHAMLMFLLLAYEVGAKVADMYGHPVVNKLLEAETHLSREAHLLCGFVRFSDYDGQLAATITPKNFVLPFIANHFVMRFSCENFLIFDKAHKAALVYENKKQGIIRLDSIQFPEADEKELQYRAMWKQFYKTIAIEARINPRCRMTHMPKRYWGNMPELDDE